MTQQAIKAILTKYPEEQIRFINFITPSQDFKAYSNYDVELDDSCVHIIHLNSHTFIPIDTITAIDVVCD